MNTWYCEARIPRNVPFHMLSMVPLNPQINRRGSPDPNCRYPILTPLTSAYWTGIDVTAIEGAGVTEGVAGMLPAVLPVHPLTSITKRRTAIARIQEINFFIKTPPIDGTIGMVHNRNREILTLLF